MNCPSKVTRQAFNQAIDDVLQTFNRTGDFLICPVCGLTIQQKTAFVSVHDARFSECAGPGRVLRVPIPYCPKCEPEIAAKESLSGCVHV